jgi:hypothetical protein
LQLPLKNLRARIFQENLSIASISTSILFLIAGFNEDQMNETLLQTILYHTPAGASTRQIIHYAQEVNSANFQMYDHGHHGGEDNMHVSVVMVNDGHSLSVLSLKANHNYMPCSGTLCSHSRDVADAPASLRSGAAVTKFSFKKVVKKLPKSCQKVAKKCQKVVKVVNKLSKMLTQLIKAKTK